MKSMSQVKRTTPRWQFLKIIMDGYLFDTMKQARYALGAACCAWRVWMLAMTEAPPKNVMSRLTIPGVGAIRIGWYEYGDKYSPRLMVRFTPTKKVRDQIRRLNRLEYEKWKASRTGTEKECSDG